MAAKSKREKAFDMFDNGLTTDSPQFKALKLKSSTKYNYLSRWRADRGIESPEEPVEEPVTTKQPASTKKLDRTKGTNLGGGEKVAMLIEKEPALIKQPVRSEEPSPPEDEPQLSEGSKGKEHSSRDIQMQAWFAPPGGNGKEPPENGVNPPSGENPLGDGLTLAHGGIDDEGLKIQCRINVKTYMLYRYVASNQSVGEDGNPRELLIGDFIDDCVEDVFLGRGLDLGIINIKKGVNQ